jgi:hypothetical protein
MMFAELKGIITFKIEPISSTARPGHSQIINSKTIEVFEICASKVLPGDSIEEEAVI